MTTVTTLEKTIIDKLHKEVRTAVSSYFARLRDDLNTLERGNNASYVGWPAAPVQWHTDKTNHGAAKILEYCAEGIIAEIVKSRTPGAVQDFVNRVNTLAKP